MFTFCYSIPILLQNYSFFLKDKQISRENVNNRITKSKLIKYIEMITSPLIYR